MSGYVVIGMLYIAYPNESRRKVTFLPKLTPYPGGIGSCVMSGVSNCCRCGPAQPVAAAAPQTVS